MKSKVDVAIIGAGIIGLATGRELLRRHPDLELRILEKEGLVAQHQTGHNSGVIHSGIYYQPGSLRARLCVEGNRAIYEFCAARQIPAERCGKLIVASSAAELKRLENLYLRGLENGIEGIRLLGQAEMRRIEPHCVGVRAILVPTTGITDYGLISRALGEEVRANGGEIVTNANVTRVDERDGVVSMFTVDGEEVQASQVIVCAGLYSDTVGRMTGGDREPSIIPFRGDYWLLRRTELVRHLIYPVPDPALPFLGVHFTRRLDGSVWLGPNAVLALSKEGYGRATTNPKELAAILAHRGFRRLARKNWRSGIREFARDLSRTMLLKDLQRYIPELETNDLLPGPSGVRAQAVTAGGDMVDDFVFEVPGTRVLNIRNAPSPAATASLIIAEIIANQSDELAAR